jgi:hypothetical protein
LHNFETEIRLSLKAGEYNTLVSSIGLLASEASMLAALTDELALLRLG